MGDALFNAQDKLHLRIRNSFSSFKKSGSLKMTECACIVQMERLEKLWNSFEKNDSNLAECEDVTGNEECYTAGFFDKVEQISLDNLGLFISNLC